MLFALLWWSGAAIFPRCATRHSLEMHFNTLGYTCSITTHHLKSCLLNPNSVKQKISKRIICINLTSNQLRSSLRCTHLRLPSHTAIKHAYPTTVKRDLVARSQDFKSPPIPPPPPRGWNPALILQGWLQPSLPNASIHPNTGLEVPALLSLHHSQENQVGSDTKDSTKQKLPSYFGISS